MIETAYAKINLALHVRRRREDGYHELETLFAFVDAGDVLAAEPAALNPKRPEDRVAVKPHASPVYHALMYMFGRQTLDKLKDFRGFGGAQSYPSRTKDGDLVDFSTGSVGLGVAQTLFASLVQDYVRAKKWQKQPVEGRMIALVGDAAHACLPFTSQGANGAGRRL